MQVTITLAAAPKAKRSQAADDGYDSMITAAHMHALRRAERQRVTAGLPVGDGTSNMRLTLATLWACRRRFAQDRADQSVAHR